MNEAELVFSEMLNCQRLFLYQNRSLSLNKDQQRFISSVLKRRFKNEPLQYILGKTEFMGWEFRVRPGVLIPRPETEVLVETVIRYVSRYRVPCTEYRVLDIGTGAGSIAVSLAKFLPDVEIDAVDISETALEVARENAKLNGVKINFLRGDLFSAFSFQLSAFSLIVSNPPYIPSEEIANLQPEIAYEPRLALDGGRDGLDFYRRIVAEAGRYLKKNGILVLEIGFGQLEQIRNILQAKKFEIIEVVRDYNNIERVIVAKIIL